MNYLNTSKHKIFFGLFWGMMFVFFWFFFTRIHPIILSDTDDWMYTFYHREAIPIWNYWNPIRVFAEVFMSLISEICSYLIYPITGDYFKTLTGGYAFSVSVFITLYAINVYKFFKKKYDMGIYSCIAIIIFYMLCHFWIFRKAESGNDYMFRASDACIYFYYVIPNIMNCIAVIWMMYDRNVLELREKNQYIKKSVFVLLIYFSIFSNIWASVIIAAFIGSELVMNMIILIKNRRFKIIDFMKIHFVYLSILMVWFVSQIFEINGGRSKSISSKSYREELIYTLNVVKSVVEKLNYKFIITISVLVVFGLYFILLNKSWDKLKIIIQFLFSFFIISLYLILSCAKAGGWYISRTDVFYGVFFFGMMIVLVCFLEMFKYLQNIKLLIPLTLMIIFFDCDTSGKTFLESNMKQLEPETVYAINNDILHQMLYAQKHGLDTIDLYVPVFDSSSKDNWPYATYATHMSKSLYKLGVLDCYIKISSIIPTEEKNHELHVN